MKLRNGISESDFLKRFPLPFVVRALSPWEAIERDKDASAQLWVFEQPFRYDSDKFGRITIPAGLVTDFASIPSFAKGIIDDDAPSILYASAPHDKLFAYPFTDGGKELSFSQVNELLIEAMYWSGASWLERAAVKSAVSTGGYFIWRKLRREN